MLVVDDRWSGKHGIGRLARELVPRLHSPWTPLTSKLNPASPLDAVNPARFGLKASDLLYSPGFNAGLTRARQLITICDLIHLEVKSESGTAKRLYYERVVRPAILKTGMVLTISEVSRNAITSWLKAPEVDVVNVGIGLSSAFTAEGPVSKPFDNFFMYVGNLKPHKNFDVLLAALRLRPNYRLVVVSADETDVVDRAKAAGVDEQIATRSNISDEDLASLYRGSDGLIFPSMLEGFGLPALEAGSSGAPVAFWSGCHSIAEILDGNGVSVEVADEPEDWAAGMDSLLDLNVFRPLEWWKTQYDWDLSAGRIDEAISRARRDV